jgi:peptidoglycan/LPS O-acetylase OafA/YrhL
VLGSHFENLSGISLHLRHSGGAVDFFFVLSGFVIGQAYGRRLAGALSWGAYMRLRLIRLYPAILGGLLLGVVAALLAGERLHPAMAAQILLLPVLWGPALHGGELFPLNGPQWSLFLELTANALHAALLRWLTVPRLAAAVALAGAVLVWASGRQGGLDVGWSRATAWGGPPRVVFGFGAGLLLFRAHAAGWRAPRAPLALVALMLGLCLVRPFPERGLWAITDPVIVLAVLPAIVALAVNAAVPAWAMGACAWLGALSYPLYAIHAPLLRIAGAFLASLDDDQAVLGWALALPAVIAMAALFERFYDAPVRAWLARRPQ